MLDQLLGAAIATSSITLWTLENDYFKNWVHELNPEYNLPGRTEALLESSSQYRLLAELQHKSSMKNVRVIDQYVVHDVSCHCGLDG